MNILQSLTTCTSIIIQFLPKYSDSYIFNCHSKVRKLLNLAKSECFTLSKFDKKGIQTCKIWKFGNNYFMVRHARIFTVTTLVQKIIGSTLRGHPHLSTTMDIKGITQLQQRWTILNFSLKVLVWARNYSTSVLLWENRLNYLFYQLIIALELS